MLGLQSVAGRALTVVALATTALATTASVSVGAVLLTGGPASAQASAAACVQYDGTSQTTPVSTGANPVPLATAGSLVAGQSAQATFTAYDSSGACVANGPIELLMGGPGTADPGTSAKCSPLLQNGSLGGNQTTCTTDSNGAVTVVFTTPTPLPSDRSASIESYGPGRTNETGTSYVYAIIAQGTSGTVVEGQHFDGPIANFTANGYAHYTANISWGDYLTSTVDLGTPPTGNTPVTADHLFTEENPNDVVSVTVTSSTGQQSTTTSSMNVTDAPLNSAGGITLSGRARTATYWELGTFSDPSPEDLSSYTETVNWGDGTASAPSGGIYTLNGSSGSNGYGFDGTHTYKKPGTYSVTITITDDGGARTTTTDTARIR